MFRDILSVNDKYPFRDVENLLSPTQLQLSLKPKSLSDFFNPFLESTSNFKHFAKKRYSSQLLYYGNYRLWKTCLDHSLENTVLENPLTVNMLKHPKLLSNMHESTFITFSITLRELDLTNISVSDMLNLRCVS